MFNQYYIPELWTVEKDVICAAIYAVEIGLENTQDILIENDINLGRTTRKNRQNANRLEREIEQMKATLEKLRSLKR